MAADLSIRPISFFPKPLPGELAQSHYERIAAFSMGDFGETMIRYRHGKSKEGELLMRADHNKLIAQACGMTEREYFDHHTLNPIYRLRIHMPKASSSERSLFNASDRETILTRGRHIVIRCPTCDHESMEDIGLRYLRRIHYVPGLAVCPRHLSDLLVLPTRDILTWRRDKTHALHEENRPMEHEGNFLPIVTRYRELSARMLETHAAFDHASMVSRVHKKLLSHGIDWNNSHSLTQIKELVLDNAPECWLRQHWRLMFEIPGYFFRSFKRRGFLTILLLSVICENVQEALGLVFNHDIAISQRPQSSEVSAELYT